jgi:hypothetical protein
MDEYQEERSCLVYNKRLATFITIVLLSLFLTSSASAGSDSTSDTPHKWLRSFGVITGFGIAPLDDKSSDYEVVPLLYQFSFDINPLAEKLHIKSRKTNFELLVEPMTNVVISPGTNAEIGCAFFLRYSVTLADWFAPYLEVGTGYIYTTQHVHEQGSQSNFITQPGIGTQFFIGNHYALTVGYRYRHMSNAGMATPNRGVDFHFGIVGLTYVFN